MATKIFRCNHCGNIITHLTNSGVPVVCCGEKMVELVPNTTDAATEKHVPDVKVDGKKVIVTVGSVEHPMVEEHFIEWILVETKQGVQVKWLKAGQKPTHEFVLSEGDELVAVYEYCNLHGLWVKNF
jgi:superoxide reductase